MEPSQVREIHHRRRQALPFVCLPISCFPQAPARNFHRPSRFRSRNHHFDSPSEKPSGTQPSSEFFVISMHNGRKRQQLKMSSRPSHSIPMTRSSFLRTRPVQRRRKRFETCGKNVRRPGLVISWKPSKVKVGKSGEMAWVSGTYELTMNDASGKPINDRGKYLEVWEKQTDGNWKCAADMWNSDLAVSAPAPAEKK